MRWSLACVVVLALPGSITGQLPAQQPTRDGDHVLDLLAPPLADLRVPVYSPKVGPLIRRLRSDAEATQFCNEAWGEQKPELHIDYDREQIVVVAWGELRWAPEGVGASVDIVVERATIQDGTLYATVRTMLPPGPGIDLPAGRAARTWYPSRFFRTPRTDRVVIDLIGARRHDGFPDFRPVTDEDFEVRIAPDACPSREQVRLGKLRFADQQPRCELVEQNGRTVCEIAWGEFGPGSYKLDLVGVLIDRGTAHLTVRAENRAIAFYSGPGVHHPGLAIELPPVDRVLLHVERLGEPLDDGEPDFEASRGERLTVTVDRSCVRSGD